MYEELDVLIGSFDTPLPALIGNSSIGVVGASLSDYNTTRIFSSCIRLQSETSATLHGRAMSRDQRSTRLFSDAMIPSMDVPSLLTSLILVI